jgi:ABC-type branched-subunit amino acid transport system ATPase component
VSEAIRARGVTVDLGSRRVLDDVSLDVDRGELTAPCGPNGGGETTVLNVATGATIILTLGAPFLLALVLRRR